MNRKTCFGSFSFDDSLVDVIYKSSAFFFDFLVIHIFRLSDDEIPKVIDLILAIGVLFLCITVAWISLV